MKSNAAIAYHPEGFDTSAKRLMGRQAAGQGFLEGLVRHGDLDTLFCCARAKAAFDDFVARTGRFGAKPKRAVFIPENRPDLLKQPGCLYYPSPTLAPLAARRATIGTSAYSLCGVTHTLASTGVMDAISAYLTAPLEPWDALICTSSAAKSAVNRIIDLQADYLTTRVGAKPVPRLELPVIPLGVDCDRFAANADASRAAWRARLGIADGDVAALFVGRLSYHAKANPAPMYIGLEAAVSALPKGARLHLVLVGWFANTALERGYRDAAAALCPSVNLIVVDGRASDARTEPWHAADLFTSLADNVQESFGLTPIEAMAAGLPSVVADWDGYRDTIVDGETGIRVPTFSPPAGTGDDLAFRYANEIDSYDRYIGGIALLTAVDVRAASEAYGRLVGDAALRRRMGEAAKARARNHYDWRVVIAAYQALWAELAARRAQVAPLAADALTPSPGVLRDPFSFFKEFPSAQLSLRHRIAWADRTAPGAIDSLLAQPIANYAPFLLLEADACRVLGEAIRRGRNAEVGELLATVPAELRRHALRTLLWFAKFGLVHIDAPTAAGA